MGKKVNILELEGFAINNQIKLFRLHECRHNEKLRSLKIIAVTSNDEEVETECLSEERVRMLITLLTNYLHQIK